MKYTTFLVFAGFIAIGVFSMVVEQELYAASFPVYIPDRVVATQQMTLGIGLGDIFKNTNVEKTFVINIIWGDNTENTQTSLLTGTKGISYFNHTYNKEGSYKVRIVVTNDEEKIQLTRVVTIPVYAIYNTAGITFFEGPRSIVLKERGIWKYNVTNNESLLPYHIVWGDGAVTKFEKPAQRDGEISHIYTTLGTYELRFSLLGEDGKEFSFVTSSVAVFQNIPKILSIITKLSGKTVQIRVNAMSGENKKGFLKVIADWGDTSAHTIREVRNNAVFSIQHRYKQSAPKYDVRVYIEDTTTKAFIERKIEIKNIPETRASLLETIFIFPFYTIWDTVRGPFMQ